MQTTVTLPWWLKPANQLIMVLNRLGVPIGTQYILTIPGRKSGKLYSTPVSLLIVDDERYICTVGETGWVKNARVAGTGTLTRGRLKEQVALAELPIAERGVILREFPRQVPHGVQFFERVLGLPNEPEAFAAAAPRCPVFHVRTITSAMHQD
jgi:hypothetical protein